MNPQYHESHLLLIDDDPDIVRLVSRALGEIGWRVTACDDPATGLGRIALDHPDVVLLDIHLTSESSGWQVLHTLRDDATIRQVPVVIFSSRIAELEEKEAWLLEQHISVLSKPFELDDLYDAVREFQRPGPSVDSVSETADS